MCDPYVDYNSLSATSSMKSGKREGNPGDRHGSRLWKRAENDRRREILLSTDLVVIAVVRDCETIVSGESKVAEIKAENFNHLVFFFLCHGNGNISKVYLFAKSSFLIGNVCVSIGHLKILTFDSHDCCFQSVKKNVRVSYGKNKE